MGILPIGDYSLMLHTSFSAESLYIEAMRYSGLRSGDVSELQSCLQNVHHYGATQPHGRHKEVCYFQECAKLFCILE